LTQFLHIHPDNPQKRLLNQVVTTLQKGGVIVYPTDSAYALGCQLGNKAALERIQALRQLDKNHNFTLVCRDLSDLGTYARVDNSVFRLLKAYTPGAYTFILPASNEVPRRLQHPKRKTIGVRVPNNNITLELLRTMGEPLMSITLIMPGDELPLSDPDTIYEQLHGKVDIVIDGGFCGIRPTTVIDLIEGIPKVIREGKGDPRPFE
jgi:tRNA threonylcarbamoyl adenosine modification protein (Sua5/YciO/YrdC/YwlC family)